MHMPDMIFKFCSWNFRLKDDQRSGRPIDVDGDGIKTIIEPDIHITVRKIEIYNTQQIKIT